MYLELTDIPVLRCGPQDSHLLVSHGFRLIPACVEGLSRRLTLSDLGNACGGGRQDWKVPSEV